MRHGHLPKYLKFSNFEHKLFGTMVIVCPEVPEFESNTFWKSSFRNSQISDNQTD